MCTAWGRIPRRIRSCSILLMKDGTTVIGNAKPSDDQMNDILFVVYTERDMLDKEGRKTEVTRLISARLATNFERGLYYGKYD